MSVDTDNLVVGSGGSVYVAAVGTTAPVDPATTPSAPWIEVGLISEEGASFTYNQTSEEFKSWQRRNAVRRDVVSEEVSANFVLQEWKKSNFQFAFGGGSITNVSASVWKYNFPTGTDDVDERSVMIRWSDNARNYQITFDRCTVSEPVEVNLSRTALAQLPISIKALSATTSDSIGVALLTDDASFGLGS